MSVTTPAPAHHFVATDHVAGRARGWVYASRVAGPLALAWSALAVLALTSALVGPDPLSWLVWAVPLTYGVVTAWAVFDLRRQPAEFVVAEGIVAVRSLWDAASPEQPLQSGPAMAGRLIGSSLYVAVDQTVYRLDPERWDDLPALHAALRAAAQGPRDVAHA